MHIFSFSLSHAPRPDTEQEHAPCVGTAALGSRTEGEGQWRHGETEEPQPWVSVSR